MLMPVDDGRVWTADEFLRDLDLAERTLRYWQQLGVVPQPVHVGGRLVYTREHEYRVIGVFRLQQRGMRKLADIATLLDNMSRDELRRLVEGEQEDALAATVEAPAAAVGPFLAAPASPSDEEPASSGEVTSASIEEQVEIALKPGLVLRVRRPIDDETRVLVGSIAALAGRSVNLPP
jgi:DNA-binding transcriptional MerR regulator